MAARVTTADVEDILFEVDENLSITPFIAAATTLVDWLDTKDTDGDLSTDALKEIERWLAAHFYSHADQLFSSEGKGGASATYQGQTGMHLDSTQYGQTAMILDITGYLAKRNKEAREGVQEAQVIWLGKPPSTQDSDSLV